MVSWACPLPAGEAPSPTLGTYKYTSIDAQNQHLPTPQTNQPTKPTTGEVCRDAVAMGEGILSMPLVAVAANEIIASSSSSSSAEQARTKPQEPQECVGRDALSALQPPTMAMNVAAAGPSAEDGQEEMEGGMGTGRARTMDDGAEHHYYAHAASAPALEPEQSVCVAPLPQK